MYAGPHIRLTWGGPLGDIESWTCGLRLWQSGFSVEGSSTTWHTDAHAACALAIDDVASIIHALHIDSRTPTSGGAKLSWVKLNPVNTSGLQWDDLSTVEYDFEVPSAGLTPMGPLQLAICATLRTDTARGRSHAGRIFIPAGVYAAGLDYSGRFADSTAQQVANSVSERIYALNAVSSWPGEFSPAVAVMSLRSAKNVTTGAGPVSMVTGVDVGRVYDTQRRRRRSVTELPAHSALAASH